MELARTRRALAALVTSLVLLASPSLVAAQDEMQRAFVIDVTAGQVSGDVAMLGAAIAPIDATTYWFSDGTEVISVSLGAPDTESVMPLLTLISLEGKVVGDHIEDATWAPLDLMTPAVVRTAAEATEAFQNWIITQNSQGPGQ